MAKLELVNGLPRMQAEAGGGGGSYTIFDATPQSIASNGTITISLDTADLLQTRRVQGNTANVVVTASATPFGATPPTDGAMIVLIGQSFTQPLEILHNDDADGCMLNGDAVLYKDYTLKLQWDATADRYIEISRNF